MKNIKNTSRVLILASGGDAPGMNACIESLYNSAQSAGIETYVAIMGYDGLVRGNIQRATAEQCTNISHMAGSVIKCGRSEEYTTDAGLKSALANIKKFKIDSLVVIGGNGSLRGLERLKNAGINVIGIPATVDNDVYFTKHSLGFSSACELSINLIDQIKATMDTNDRNHIVQVMGWNCNELTMKIGIAGFADIIDINEHRHTPEEIVQIFKKLRTQGKTSSMMIMQERKFGNDFTREYLETATFFKKVMDASDDKRLRTSVLGHLQRGANPSCHDRWLGANYGAQAVKLITENKFGYALGFIAEKFCYVPLEDANQAESHFDEDYYQMITKKV